MKNPAECRNPQDFTVKADEVRCLKDIQYDRTVVAALHVRKDRRVPNRMSDAVGYQEIVDTPADIPLAGIRHIGPPGIGIAPVWMKVPETVR